MARAELNRSRIVSAGVIVAGELGLSALSLRAVARRIRTTEARAQRFISGTELVEAVVGEMMATMPSPPPRGHWPRRLRRWATDTYQWLVDHPGLPRYLQVNRWDTLMALDRCEELATVLGEVGLSEEDQVRAGTVLFDFVVAAACADESCRVIGTELAVERIAGSVDRWPLLGSQSLGSPVQWSVDKFEFGLDLMMTGIEVRCRTS